MSTVAPFYIMYHYERKHNCTNKLQNAAEVPIVKEGKMLKLEVCAVALLNGLGFHQLSQSRLQHGPSM